MEERFVKQVRAASHDEPVDDGWRVIDLTVDSFEETSAKERDWPEDLAELYWWRPRFWRREIQHG